MSEPAVEPQSGDLLRIAITKAVEEDLIDLQVLGAGVAAAELEVARTAALQLAQSQPLYPSSLFAMLQRLGKLRVAIAAAKAEGIQKAVIDPLEQLHCLDADGSKS